MIGFKLTPVTEQISQAKWQEKSLVNELTLSQWGKEPSLLQELIWENKKIKKNCWDFLTSVVSH